MVNRSGRGQNVVAADATSAADARRACAGATAVFHCANGPYGQWASTLPAMMDGIIEGAASAGAKLVYGDNLYAYGPVDGPITEDLPYRPVGPNTSTRAALATRLMESHARGIVRATIGRASDFFGPDVHLSTVGDEVFARALAGRPARMVGNPDLPHTYTYIEDFAAGLVTLASHDQALGEVWHVPSAETITARAFIELVFKQLGKPPRLQVAPRIAVSAMALFVPTMKGVREVLYQSEHPWVVDHSKFAKVFGSNPTPHPHAIAQTLEWFRVVSAKSVSG